MSYRNILVQTEDSVAGRMQVQAALDLARRFGATLTGVYLKSEQVPALFAGDAFSAVTLMETFLGERAEQITTASAAARDMFEKAALEARVPFHWAEINGDNEHALTEAARRHDLSILRREVQPAGSSTGLLASQVAMAAGTPIVIVPEAGYPIPFGLKPMIAWKESRESARVLHDAIEFIEKATSVTFFTVSATASHEFDDFQRRYLAAHGCTNAKLIVDRADDFGTSKAIRLRASMVGADLLVMGLYGHSRVRELFLGGVSRDILGDLTMPILVSH